MPFMWGGRGWKGRRENAAFLWRKPQRKKKMPHANLPAFPFYVRCKRNVGWNFWLNFIFITPIRHIPSYELEESHCLKIQKYQSSYKWYVEHVKQFRKFRMGLVKKLLHATTTHCLHRRLPSGIFVRKEISNCYRYTFPLCRNIVTLSLSGLEIASLQGDGKYTTSSFLRYTSPLEFGVNGTNDFTFCARLSVEFLRGISSHFVSMANEDDTNAYIAYFSIDYKQDQRTKAP